MKIILSRKGVDSSAGGFASPVFPDGSMLSIPIPDKRSPVRYRDLLGPEKMSTLVRQLSNGRIKGGDAVHLDPDLQETSIKRETEFQPLFGQCGAAQSHLASHQVRGGDLFLFFGWFRRVAKHQRRWRYVPGAPNLHVVYGWMQIKDVVATEQIGDGPEWRTFQSHPHCHGQFNGDNTIYTGRKTLSVYLGKKGAGVFGRYSDIRCLTAENRSRSIWQLPAWMHPEGRESTLSYHSDLSRWHRCPGSVELRSAARGQEFVLDVDHYPEAVDWLENLFTAK